MCQPHGARCYNDSSKKLDKINAKLTTARGELSAAQGVLADSARKSDFRSYAKTRKQIDGLQKKVDSYETDLRHTQRDVDSTRTGRKMLAEEIKNARTKEDLKALDVRRRTAEGIRFSREHAGELKKSGYQSPIRFASKAA
jgi:chromosome segregation ATPase